MLHSDGLQMTIK